MSYYKSVENDDVAKETVSEKCVYLFEKSMMSLYPFIRISGQHGLHIFCWWGIELLGWNIGLCTCHAFGSTIKLPVTQNVAMP